MNKLTKLIATSIVAFSLTACGGGGGGGDSSGGGDTGGGTTPTNKAPTLTLGQSSVSMNENTTLDVSVTTADSDGDTVTLTVSSSNSDVATGTVTGGKLVVSASDVATDSTATLTVTASDGKDSVKKTVTVSVKDIPDTSYTAFNLSWENSGATYLYVKQGASAVYPFLIDAGSVSVEQLQYSVNVTLSGGAAASDVTASVDSNNQQVVVRPNDQTGEFEGVLTVTDGQTTKTLNFKMKADFANRTPFLDSERIIFLEEGESKTFELVTSEGIDPAGVKISENNPFEVLQGDASHVTFTYDNTAKTYTLTANQGSKYKAMIARIYVTDSFDTLGGQVFEIYVKGSESALEKDLEEKIVLAKKYVEQSDEMVRLGEFIVDALELDGTMTRLEAQKERSQINDSRYISATDSTTTLNCMANSIIDGMPRFTMVDTSDWTYKRICNVGESEIFNSVTATLASNHYEDAGNYAVAVNSINQIRNNQSNFLMTVNGETLEQRVNRLASMLNSASPSFNMGSVSWEELTEVSDGFYSRYVGNTAYGSYSGDTWVWKPEYEVLGLAVAKANGTVNW